MYFKLTTGRIVTVREVRTAYEIVYGGKPDENTPHYNDWINSVYGIDKVILKSEITIEQLIKGDAFVEAVKLYKDQHKCTLAEAREVCTQIKMEMEA